MNITYTRYAVPCFLYSVNGWLSVDVEKLVNFEHKLPIDFVGVESRKSNRNIISEY